MSLFGSLGSLLNVSKSSSSNATTTSSAADNRQVYDAGGGIIGSNNDVDNSTSWYQLSQQTSSSNVSNSGNTSAWYTDTSNRSTNNSGNTSAYWSSATSTSNSGNTSANWSSADNSDRSTNNSGNTSANWSTSTANSGNTSANWTDNSRSSTAYTDARSTTTNSYGTDPGVAHINDTNAALLATLGQQQGDAMSVIANLGTTGIKQMGESATSLFGQAEQNAAQVWSNTLDASNDALDRMFSAAAGITTASTTLAQSAMSTYQPADSKASDNQVKIALLGAAAIVLAAMISKKG